MKKNESCVNIEMIAEESNSIFVIENNSLNNHNFNCSSQYTASPKKITENEQNNNFIHFIKNTDFNMDKEKRKTFLVDLK